MTDKGSGTKAGGARAATRAGAISIAIYCAAIGWVWHELGWGIGQCAAEAASIYLTLLAYTVVHEGAHALAAWGTGLAVSHVVIGTGPKLVEWRLGVVAWRIHAIPLTGGMHVVWMGRPWKKVVTLLAGPVVPALIGLVIGTSFFTSVAILGLANLVPFEVKGMASDGKRIGKVLRDVRARRRERGLPSPHAERP